MLPKTLRPVQTANTRALAAMFDEGGFSQRDLPFLEHLGSSLFGPGEFQLKFEAYLRALRGEKRQAVRQIGSEIATAIRTVLPEATTDGISLFGDSRKTIAALRRRLNPIREYKFGRLLGKGGSAFVISGTRKRDGKRVAIKLLTPASKKENVLRRGFEREQKLLALLRHPALPTVVQWGREFGKDKVPFLVMEYIEGPTLNQYLVFSKSVGRKGALSWGEAKFIALKLADLLEMLHQGRIVYRDLKPENIILLREGKKIKGIKLVDFGIILNLNDWKERRDAGIRLAGTPLYMSPEQVLLYPQDGRSDVYGLGVLMFHLLTGVPPFDGRNLFEVMGLHVGQPVPLFREANPRLKSHRCAENIVLKAMAKNPAHRFQSMAEMAQAIRVCF